MVYLLFVLLLLNVFLLQFRLDDILNNLGKILNIMLIIFYIALVLFDILLTFDILNAIKVSIGCFDFNNILLTLIK